MMTEYESVQYHGIELQSVPGNKTHSVLNLANNLEEHQIETSFGFKVHVYVQHGKKQTPLLTFHDIGTNHTQFISFFNYPEMRILLSNYTVYHICAPGHHENASTILQEDCSKNQPLVNSAWSVSSMFGGKSTQRTQNHYPTIEELPHIVDAVVKHFRLQNILGFAVGAGANVLIRYALKNPSLFMALFLINPTASAASYYQWLKLRWSDVPQMQQGIITDPMMNFLDAHWFGYNQAEHMDVVEHNYQTMRSLNLVHVASYIDAFLNRTDLGLVRELDKKKQTPQTCLQVDCCLVTGEKAVDQTRAMTDMNGRMDPARTQYLIIPECTGMILEENPAKLAIDFLYFLRTIGQLITLTKEKLIQEAAELQKSTMLLRNDTELPSVTMLPENVC